ncbi:MAG TPA: helix-turn-helix domain-containing protein [Candidatus Udaeobacter sp.]|nr:helix-turn-helix domain-containing protein [Candidatus Udaeobacter sp.]
MSIKVATQVWERSRHKSGNLLVLLALADHADDYGRAWPGIPRLARKARLSERHTRRCLNQLVATGEVEILPDKAPSGRTWYQIRVDQLMEDDLSIGTSESCEVPPASDGADAADRKACPIYINESSIEPSEESSSQVKIGHVRSQKPIENFRARRPDALGLVSPPKGGF